MIKISDAIKELQRLQGRHGDLPIHTFDDVDFNFQTPSFEVIDPNTDQTCIENKGLFSIGSSPFVSIV